MWHMHGQHTIEQFKKYHSAIPLEVNDMLVSFDTFCICLSIISKKVKSKRGTVGYNHLFKENEGWETSNLSTTGYSMLKLVALTAFNILICLDRGIFASFVWQQCRKKKVNCLEGGLNFSLSMFLFSGDKYSKDWWPVTPSGHGVSFFGITCRHHRNEFRIGQNPIYFRDLTTRTGNMNVSKTFKTLSSAGSQTFLKINTTPRLRWHLMCDLERSTSTYLNVFHIIPLELFQRNCVIPQNNFGWAPVTHVRFLYGFVEAYAGICW